MKRKTTALMMALTLSVSLSACGDKTAVSTETTDIESVEETVEITEATEEAEVTEEESTPEPEPEITAEEKLQSAIGEMPYYGDTANCKMTAEQATAYAQLIADGLAGDFSFRGGYDEGVVSDIISWNKPFYIYEYDNAVEVDRKNVILADFSGDGNPYLYLYSSNNSKDSYEIYGWLDNTAKLAFDIEANAREGYYLYEDENDQGKMKLTYEGAWGMAEEFITYSFANGATEEIYTRMEELKEDNSWHVTENGIETEVYTEDEYYAMRDEREQEKTHNHTLPYTCFYDMTPCTLEEMVNYLNAYASAMSDGQSVPVEIKKVDIVKHDGTGITTKGEVPQEKVNSLEILRQYMTGKMGIGVVNDGDSTLYANEFGEQWEGSKNFYFDLKDINNDGSQDLKVSYKDADRSSNITNLYLGSSYEDGLSSINGVNPSEGTYLCTGGSVFAVARLYVYDGTTFSLISALNESDTPNGELCYTLDENGATREISKEEFDSIWNDWENKHTDFSADTHLDIENIENTFQVKIDVQSSGEWLVTSAE